MPEIVKSKEEKATGLFSWFLGEMPEGPAKFVNEAMEELE